MQNASNQLAPWPRNQRLPHVYEDCAPGFPGLGGLKLGVLNTLISPPINTSPRPKTFWRSFVGYPGWTRCFEFQNQDEIRYLSKTFDSSYSTSIDLFDLKSFTWESSFLQEFLVVKHQQHCAKILLNTNIQGHKLIYLNQQTNRCTYR